MGTRARPFSASARAATIALAGTGVFAIACSSLDAVNYGPSDGLLHETPPQPVGVDAGAVASDAAAAPDTASGVPLDSGSPCAVSWAADIFPKMAPTGSWRCGDAVCHGGFQSPKMTADPSSTYDALARYKMVLAPQKLLYVAVGDTDPTHSGLECNLAGATCGNRMPIVSNGAHFASVQDITTIDTWLRCGSPKN